MRSLHVNSDAVRRFFRANHRQKPIIEVQLRQVKAKRKGNFSKELKDKEVKAVIEAAQVSVEA